MGNRVNRGMTVIGIHVKRGTAVGINQPLFKISDYDQKMTKLWLGGQYVFKNYSFMLH